MAWVTPITNRTDASKGYFGVTEWNRIEGNHAYLAAALGVTITTKTNWAITDVPTLTDIDRLRANTNTLLLALDCSADVRLKLMRNYTDYVEINALEQDLQSMKTLLDTGREVGMLAVGDVIRDTATIYGGVAIEWLVAHQVAGRTKFISKYLLSQKAFDAAEPTNPTASRQTFGSNRYAVSNIRQWLKSSSTSWYSAQTAYDEPPPYVSTPGFLTNFSANLRGKMLTNSIACSKDAVDGGGIETLTDKIYLPSVDEVGFTYLNEGTVWTIFVAGTNSSRIANIVGTTTAGRWIMRTRFNGEPDTYVYASEDGSLKGQKAFADVSHYIRPAFELSSTTKVSVGKTNGAYTLL